MEYLAKVAFATLAMLRTPRKNAAAEQSKFRLHPLTHRRPPASPREAAAAHLQEGASVLPRYMELPLRFQPPSRPFGKEPGYASPMFWSEEPCLWREHTLDPLVDLDMRL